jgi:zinc protease
MKGRRYTRSVRRILVALVLALCGVLPVPARGQDSVVATTLDNGLRVLLLEDHRSPIVSFQTWYRVGSRNEQRGLTGLAHFLEHLMFKGTQKYGPRQFARLVEENGGRDNAFTTQDVTSYFVDIAADRLDLIIDLEADRMHNLVLDTKDIESERQVVIEERRTRTEDDPGGFLGEAVGSIAFRAHPYGQPIIGWVVDLERLTPEQIRAFYRTYYVPNNATVVVAGDFKAAETLEKIKQRFGSIPRGPDPPPMLAVEPAQNGERRVTVSRKAELPIVYLAYHVPNWKSEDASSLEVLSAVLAGGRTSRIYKNLIYDRQLALDAGGDYSYFSFDPNLFWFWATPMPGQAPDVLEKALLDEMERLKREPVTAEELQRAKNQIEASFVFAEDSVHRRASLVARFDFVGGAAEKARFLERIRSVTDADLMRVAQAWFPASLKNVGVLIPKP